MSEREPEKAKKGGGCSGVVALGLLALIAVVLWLIWPSSGSRSGGLQLEMPTSRSMTYRVTYVVTGSTNRASVTYSNSQDNTEQRDVLVPWEVTYTMAAGQFAYVSAQNDNDWGTIECVIELDGVAWEQAKSSGAYKIASCSGSVGK